MAEDHVETAGKFRELSPLLGAAFNGLLAGMTVLGGLWAAGAQDMLGLALYRQQYLAALLCVALLACFLGVKARQGEQGGKVPWYDWLAMAFSAVATIFITLYYPQLASDVSSATPERVILGGGLALVILEASRRLVGWALAILAIAAILYTRFAEWFPGVLNAPASDWGQIATYLYLDGNGIFGLPLNVFGSIIITFIVFGQALYAVGGDKVLTNAALVLMGRFRGGPAKVAVGGSSLFGTISGSVLSNVMTDGPITIPMMIKTGYRRHIAAAIEAVASNGGQVMPPVMGIAAFLIADWLNISYGQVVLAALVPALLYYVALFAQVDFEAGRQGMTGLPASELPSARPLLRTCWVFVVPLGVLAWTLVGVSWQPGKSALTAAVVALLMGAILKETRPGLKSIWGILVNSGRLLLDLAAVTAVAGLIIGGLQLSGLAFNLSLVLVTLAFGSVIALLILTALISIVLGMGLPTTVIYILLASLVAPALVDAGIPPLAAHLFIFYFGTLSSITPPLCFATFAAASIAQCNFWRAGWSGMRLGFVAYLIPFVFVFQPELLMIGEPFQIAVAIVTSTIGVILVSAAFSGYIFATLNSWLRLALAFSGVALIPSPAGHHALILLNIAGLVVGLAVLVPLYLASRKRKRAPAGAV